MNSYVIDSCSLIKLGHFFPSRFPSLWKHIETLTTSGRLISVKECRKEIDSYGNDDFIKVWAKDHSSIFLPATPKETQFVSEIFAVKHFSTLISEKAILQGKTVADPFLIASAKINSFTLVTEELYKDKAAKIPNVCRHFGVKYITLEELMEMENLTF